MGQIDQLLRRVAGAPVRTVLLWRSRGISWKVITSNLLPVPSLYIKHHQLLPSRAGNGQDSTYAHKADNSKKHDFNLKTRRRMRIFFHPILHIKTETRFFEYYVLEFDLLHSWLYEILNSQMVHKWFDK